MASTSTKVVLTQDEIEIKEALTPLRGRRKHDGHGHAFGPPFSIRSGDFRVAMIGENKTRRFVRI